MPCGINQDDMEIVFNSHVFGTPCTIFLLSIHVQLYTFYSRTFSVHLKFTLFSLTGALQHKKRAFVDIIRSFVPLPVSFFSTSPIVLGILGRLLRLIFMQFLTPNIVYFWQFFHCISYFCKNIAKVNKWFNERTCQIFRWDV